MHLSAPQRSNRFSRKCNHDGTSLVILTTIVEVPNSSIRHGQVLLLLCLCVPRTSASFSGPFLELKACRFPQIT
jgi:hypothetical protein